MLAFGRKVGQSFRLQTEAGTVITVIVTQAACGFARFAIDAPKHIPVLRDDAKKGAHDARRDETAGGESDRE